MDLLLKEGSMSLQGLIVILERARTDSAFRAIAGANPLAAAQSLGVNLTEDEVAALASIDWGKSEADLVRPLSAEPGYWGPVPEGHAECITRFDLQGAPGKSAELHEWFLELVKVPTKSHKGLPKFMLLAAMGRPGMYTCLGAWAHTEDGRAFFESTEYERFLQEHPLTGIATLVRPVECFEVVFEVDTDNTPGESPYDVLEDWTLDPRPFNVPEFESNRQVWFVELLKHATQSGFLGGLIARSLRSPYRFQILYGFQTLSHAKTGMAHQAMRMFEFEHPVSAYTSTPPIVEAYQRLHRT